MKPVYQLLLALLLALPMSAQQIFRHPIRTSSTLPPKYQAPFLAADAPSVKPAAADTCEGSTFVRLIGTAGTTERGYTLCLAGDGNLYVAGLKQDSAFLLKFTPDGAILWARAFDFLPGLNDNISEIIVDSDGFITGCGSTAESSPGTGFIFRYDPQNDALVWSRQLDNAGILMYGLLEKNPGGDFLIYFNPLSGGDDAELLQIDRQTGAVAGTLARRYHLGASDQFSAMVMHQGDLYGVGRLTNLDLLTDMRHSLCRLDTATGLPDWVRLSHVPAGLPARLYGRDLIVDDGALISTFSGNDQGENLTPSNVFLQKTTLDGDLVWLKKLDLTAFQAEWAEEIVRVSDGYVLFGRSIEAQDNLFVLKTDLDGNTLWARKFDYSADDNVYFYSNLQAQLVELDGFLYMTAYSLDALGAQDLMLVKLDSQGNAGDSCTFLTPTDVITLTVVDPVNLAVDLTISDASTQTAEVVAAAIPTTAFTVQTLCEDECDEDDLCADAVLTLDSLICSGGNTFLHYTLCNLGDTILPSPIGMTLYDANPLTGPANALEFFVISHLAGIGGCQSGVLSGVTDFLPAGGNLVLYSLLNTNGTESTPISLDSFPFTNLVECSYANNLDSVVIQLPTAPTLDLGPDVTVCEDAPYVFHAGPGFASYLWHDGSTDSTFTATTPQTVSVEVTDGCGFVQRDTAIFTWSLLADIQQIDRVICPGDSVLVVIPGFDNYVWNPTTGLSCTDCDSIVIRPDVTTTYTLLATTTLGCVLTDTFTITIQPLPSRAETLEFCAGDAVTINGIQYTQSATAVDTLPAITGCDTVITYTLVFNALPTRTETIDRCVGESVTINGITYTQSGTVVDTLPSVTGPCDTIVTYTLNFAPLLTRTDTLNLLFGQSVTINGITYTQPAIALDTLPAAAGCDTALTYVLLFSLPPGQVTLTCPPTLTVDPMPGMASAMVMFDPPAVSTTCPFGMVTLTQTAGPASGVLFPVGSTEVCFAALDTCGGADSCCFTVTVNEEEACDVKTVGCVTFELLSIALDAEGDRHYRLRFTNGCAGRALTYLAVQVPDGTTAVGPANGSTYTAPSGRGYTVRNPNSNPFHSVRFKAQGPGISNGQSDIFEYTIVEQSQPTFIHVFARLTPGPSYEAHLNVYDCPILMLHQDLVAPEGEFRTLASEEAGDDGPVETGNPGEFSGDAASERSPDEGRAGAGSLAVFPNPSDGRLYVDLSDWMNEEVTVYLLNSQGQRLESWNVVGAMQRLTLPAKLTNGMYYLEAVPTGGGRAVGRFLLNR